LFYDSAPFRVKLIHKYIISFPNRLSNKIKINLIINIFTAIDFVKFDLVTNGRTLTLEKSSIYFRIEIVICKWNDQKLSLINRYHISHQIRQLVSKWQKNVECWFFHLKPMWLFVLMLESKKKIISLSLKFESFFASHS
jgi:hypothetical protein